MLQNILSFLHYFPKNPPELAVTACGSDCSYFLQCCAPVPKVPAKYCKSLMLSSGTNSSHQQPANQLSLTGNHHHAPNASPPAKRPVVAPSKQDSFKRQRGCYTKPLLHLVFGNQAPNVSVLRCNNSHNLQLQLCPHRTYHKHWPKSLLPQLYQSPSQHRSIQD